MEGPGVRAVEDVPSPGSSPEGGQVRGAIPWALPAGNALAAALVTHLAEDLGIRVLLLKGFGLEQHGLRAGHVSADTDVLVDPRRFGELFSALQARGWTERPTSLLSRRITVHSRTLVRDGWPNDLDVHSEFPGLLVERQSAFETLWRDREPCWIAGVRCWIPSRAASLVIWALHSLRGSRQQDRHRTELDALVTRVLPALTAPEREAVRRIVAEVRAELPLREVFATAGIELPEGTEPDADALRAWQRKVAQAAAFSPWTLVLREAGWRERPYLAWRALWPSNDDLRGHGLPPGAGAPARVRLRVVRVVRKFRRTTPHQPRSAREG